MKTAIRTIAEWFSSWLLVNQRKVFEMYLPKIIFDLLWLGRHWENLLGPNIVEGKRADSGRNISYLEITLSEKVGTSLISLSGFQDC